MSGADTRLELSSIGSGDSELHVHRPSRGARTIGRTWHDRLRQIADQVERADQLPRGRVMAQCGSWFREKNRKDIFDAEPATAATLGRLRSLTQRADQGRSRTSQSRSSFVGFSHCFSHQKRISKPV